MPSKARPVDSVIDPVESARAAGLRYVSDARPGIQRLRRGEGFRYVGVDGSPVRDKEVLARIKSLVIPPAWTGVWICPNPKGHLQATGRDVKGRKQSRYHPHWRQVRDETKYERMLLFGAALPRIRKRVEHDLSLPGLPRAKVLATIVRLMEMTLIRIGNEEYARENKSYGLTTMRSRHVEVDGSTVKFTFLGKSRVQHAIDVSDRRLAKIVQRCLDLPGYELFQYIDPEGDHRTIDSSDVNEYLHDVAEGHFTAKDFRTWAGTVLACMTLQEFEAFGSESQAKKNVVQAIKQVAQRLGNTVSVCRKCYIHPAVLEHYMGGSMVSILATCAEPLEANSKKHDLRREEVMLMHLLQQKLGSSSVTA